MKEMQLEHLHQEYVERPEKDKKCVDMLMYIILGIVLGTILVRVIHMCII